MSSSRTGENHRTENTEGGFSDEIQSGDTSFTREVQGANIEHFSTCGEWHENGKDDEWEFDGRTLGKSERR